MNVLVVDTQRRGRWAMWAVRDNGSSTDACNGDTSYSSDDVTQEVSQEANNQLFLSNDSKQAIVVISHIINVAVRQSSITIDMNDGR